MDSAMMRFLIASSDSLGFASTLNGTRPTTSAEAIAIALIGACSMIAPELLDDERSIGTCK